MSEQPTPVVDTLTRSLLPELPYVVHAENHESHAEFVVYKVVEQAFISDESQDTHVWAYAERIDSSASPDPTLDRAKADWFLQGSVKWDGCSNWQFNDAGVMIHFCSEDQSAQIGELFRRLYAWARELGQDQP